MGVNRKIKRKQEVKEKKLKKKLLKEWDNIDRDKIIEDFEQNKKMVDTLNDFRNKVNILIIDILWKLNYPEEELRVLAEQLGNVTWKNFDKGEEFYINILEWIRDNTDHKRLDDYIPLEPIEE